MAAILVINDRPATRTVTDGVLATNTALTSATAAFTQADVGRSVHGTGITEGTRIASVTNATTVVLSSASTATASGVTVTIGGSRAPDDVVTTSASTAITSAANADFTASDVGKPITGAGIPAGAYIAAVASATAATLSVAATASATITATIGAGLVEGDRTVVFNGVPLVDPTTGSTIFKRYNGLQQVVDALLSKRAQNTDPPVLLNTDNLGFTSA